MKLHICLPPDKDIEYTEYDEHDNEYVISIGGVSIAIRGNLKLNEARDYRDLVRIVPMCEGNVPVARCITVTIPEI